MIDPSVVVLAAIVAFFYVRGVRIVRHDAIPVRRRVSFFAGLLAVCVALSRYVEGAAATRFSAHMVQHMILLTVAPPLLVYGRPTLALLMSMSLPARRKVRELESGGPVSFVLRVGGHPAVVGGLYTVALWSWHLPAAYQEAIRSAPVHASEHLTFLAIGLLFWGTVIGAGTRRRVSYPAALALVFATMLPGVWLAMILTFAPHLVYPVYGSHAGALADQELAGALMWAPMALISAVAIGALVLRWFRVLDMRNEVRPKIRIAGQP
jgi:cytochrome c oxidase assembly factor CtaG